MNRKRTFIDKFSDFVSGKGFYLVVLVCVAAIALSGYYLVRSVQSGLPDEDGQPVSATAAITVSSAPTVKATTPPSAQPTAAPTAPPTVQPTAEPSQTPSAEPTPTAASTALVFTWPVNGTVIVPFSVEALAYDETMGDWRTHGGVDIAAVQGTHVLAAASGSVAAVYEDDLMGTTVVIDHGNGLSSVYSNLAEVPTVSAGDTVGTGAIIGSVGATAAAESGRASHLHFAMYLDNVAVNPEDYLPS